MSAQTLISSTNPRVGDVRILILTSSFPRYPGDIAGCFVLEHTLEIVKAGHSVHVLAWRDREPSVGEYPRGLEVTWVEHAAQNEGLFFADGAPENLERDPTRALWALPAMASMLGAAWNLAPWADLIIGHWLVPSGLLARTLGELFDKPSLVIGHSGGVHALASLPRPFGRVLAEFVSSGATSLTTEPLRQKLARITSADHVRVLPMGFHPVPTPTVDERPLEAVAMGRLVPIKNTELAIQAAMLSESCAHLHILGDGPERRRLEDLADPSRVTFHGVLRGGAKAEILSRCRVSLFPSIIQQDRHEGLPVSLLECAHAGATPIVGEVPGSEGLLFSQLQRPEMTPEGWAQSIDTLIELDRSDEARALVEPFTWAVLGPIWTEWIGAVTQTSW